MGPFLERVREAAREVDIVHLEETETAWCDEGVDTPSVVHLHYLARRDRGLGLPWQGSFLDGLELALGERAAIRRHRYLAASSPLIAESLGHASPKAEVVVAPLSLDPALYRPAPLEGPPTAGIVGTAAWPPTASSIRTLVHELWPLVRRRAPEAQLLVAGRGTEALGLPRGDGVEVVGEVASAMAFLRRLSVLVFPLRRGSGMKVKVLEAIACGVPVVTTPAGAEGIEAPGGMAVHDDPDALAAETACLLLDEAERRERGAAARSAFETRYEPAPATRPLVELYARMIASA